MSRLPAALLLTGTLLLMWQSALARETATAPDFTLLLLRHAEKETGPDPALSARGKARAQQLASELALAPVQAVWSTDTRRTRATAAPLVQKLQLPLQIYQGSELQRFARRLLSDGRNAVVLGHSNTTPELAALLCQCNTPAISETDYDWIYQLEVRADTVRFSRYRQTR